MKPALRWVAGLLFAYALLCTGLWFAQERLLFFPRPNNSLAVAELAARGGQDWSLQRGAVTLRGWFMPAAEPEQRPLVLYYGGNAQDVARTAAQRDVDANVLYVNYRGYGSSDGRPGAAALRSDALAVFDAARGLPHNGRVVVWGRSLGSGLAVHTAAHRVVAAVVLVTPYDSIAAVAARRFPGVPVRTLLRHNLDSAALAPQVMTPALVLIAPKDRVVPARHAEALVARWGGPVERRYFPQASHRSIGSSPAFLEVIAGFIGRHAF